MELTVIGDELLGPKLPQYDELLFETTPSGRKLLPHRAVLGFVPADADAELESTVAHQAEFRCLLRDEHRLEHRQNQDPGSKPKPRRSSRERGEEHEEVAKWHGVGRGGTLIAAESACQHMSAVTNEIDPCLVELARRATERSDVGKPLAVK